MYITRLGLCTDSLDETDNFSNDIFFFFYNNYSRSDRFDVFIMNIKIT